MTPRTLDFHDHRRDLNENRYIYAVVSRRANGLSIGVNLNPDKVCNFACPYCQVDRTTPGSGPEIDVPQLAAELRSLLTLVANGTLWDTPPFDTAAPALRRVVDIAFAGDGEPTTPPAFPAVAAAVSEIRAEFGLDAPIRLLTNTTMLHRDRVRAALVYIDDVWCKLDAGTEPYYRLVDGTSFPFRRVLSNLLDTARLRPITVQSMFLTIDGVGPPPEEIAAWVGRLAHIRSHGGTVDVVQVYTVARTPASPRIAALDRVSLDAIADRARGLGVLVDVYDAETT